MDYSPIEVLRELKDKSCKVKDIKFNCKTEFLAVGFQDSEIIIYNIKIGYQIYKKFYSNKNPIVSFDFDQSGNFLKSLSSGFEVNHYDLENSCKVNGQAPDKLIFDTMNTLINQKSKVI